MFTISSKYVLHIVYDVGVGNTHVCAIEDLLSELSQRNYRNEIALNMKEQGVYISFMYNNHSDQNKIKTITASDFLSSF